MVKLKDYLEREILSSIDYVHIKYFKRYKTFDQMKGTDILNRYGEIVFDKKKGPYTVTYNNKKSIKIQKMVETILSMRSNIIEDEINIRNEIVEIIKDIHLENPKNKSQYIQTRVKKLLSDISKNDVHTFFFKVYGIKSKKRRDFGELTIIPTKRILSNILREYKISVKDEFFLNLFEKSNAPYIIVKINVVAPSYDTAYKIAIEKSEKTLRMFNLFTNTKPILDEEYKHKSHKKVSLLNGKISYGSGISHFSPSHRPIDIDDAYSKYPHIMRKLNILLKKNRNDLENKIILSTWWYSESLDEDEKLDKILKLIISLETLLLSQGGQKKNTLSERAAFIYTTKPKDRKFIYDIISEAYMKRNELVHEGDIKNRHVYFLTKNLSEFVRRLIVICLTNKSFNNLDEMVRYVEKKKFA